MTNVFRLFNTEEHKINLERIFLYNDNGCGRDRKFSIEDYLPFMAFCQRCGLYFNQIKNEKEVLCLYHPGVITIDFFLCSTESFRVDSVKYDWTRI
jgi:hypothetical protein